MHLTTTHMSMLYERHSAALLRYFMRRTFDHQVAVDMVGETFAVALENRKKFRGDSLDAARSWLYGIGTNLLNDYFRSGQIERRAMERLQMQQVAPNDDDIARIDDLAEIADLRGAVATALTGLDSDYRAAVQLRVIDQCDYDEIASRLGVSEQAVRARVSRGLKKLRSAIDERDGKEAGDA